MGTLLNNNIENNQYILNGGNKAFLASEINISESSDRRKLLETISNLQDSFFEKLKQYDLEESLHSGSERSQRLFSECEDLNRASQKLIDQL